MRKKGILSIFAETRVEVVIGAYEEEAKTKRGL